MLRKFLLEERTYLLSMLPMTISNREEMAVLESTEMRNGDPHILIDLVRVTWWNTCFCSKCKLSYWICIHLFWITRVIWQWSQVCWVNWLSWFLFWLWTLTNLILIPKVDLICRLLATFCQWVWSSCIIRVPCLWLALLIILALSSKLIAWIWYILCQSFALCDLVQVRLWSLMCWPLVIV